MIIIKPFMHSKLSLVQRIIVTLFIFHATNHDNNSYSSNKVVALSTSGYEEICSLSERLIKIKYRNGKFVKVNDSDESDTYSIDGNYDNSNDTNRILKSLRKRTLSSSFPNTSSSTTSSTTTSTTSYTTNSASIPSFNSQNYNDQRRTLNQDDIFFAKECPCGSSFRNTATYCIIRTNESHCQVPRSSTDPIECFHSSVSLVFIRNLWPLSLLWLLALVLYLISTEAGRSVVKYIFSKICCCFGNACNNSRIIDNIISREMSMRELYQIASLTRAQEYAQRSSSTVVTYILKTKAYFSGSSKKTPEKSVELTKHDDNDDDICQSPSNETLLTSPDSLASSPSFEDVLSPLAIDDHHNTHQQQSFASPSQINKDGENSDEDEEETICTICMLEIQDGDRVGVLECEHLFHADCLKEWIKRRNVCPLCQTKMAEEKTEGECNPVPRVRYPTTFTVRTTGAAAEPTRRRSRGRRTREEHGRAVTRTSGIGHNDTARRQLFVVNSNSRIPPSVTSRAGVTIISARMGPSNQRRILVGDAAGTNRARNNVVGRRPMQITALQSRRNS